jgi:hypothetical protein
MRKHRLVRALVCFAIVAALIQAPAMAHPGLKIGRYECWLSQIAMYSNFDLKIQSGGRYVFMLNDGSWRRAGNFTRDGNKLRFTSGYLKNQNFKGKHDSYNDSFGIHTHMVYLYKGTYDLDDLKYDCNNN